MGELLQKLVQLSAARRLLELDSYSKRELKNDGLKSLVGELTRDFDPTSHRESLAWSDLYMPLMRGKRQICVPFSVTDYSNAITRKNEFIMDFGQNLGGLVVMDGKEKVAPSYLRMFESAIEFNSSLPGNLEAMVPYEFRTGTILRRHTVEEDERVSFMEKAEAESILRQYQEQEVRPAGQISLDEYLGTAAVCYSAAYGEDAMADPVATYERHSDIRHGGMLELRDSSSKEEFGKWLRGEGWSGSHPFEIVFSFHNHGILLYPPGLGGSEGYVLMVMDPYMHGMYVTMLRELWKEGIPVSTPEVMLKEALEFLTGEARFTVNYYSENQFNYYGTAFERKMYFEHIAWDSLKVLQRKG